MDVLIVSLTLIISAHLPGFNADNNAQMIDPSNASNLPGISDVGDPSHCGVGPRPATAISQKIVGGRQSGIKDWPWQVALVSNCSNSTVCPGNVWHYCGGAIVTQSHVITAAHCVDSDRNNASSVMVRVGEYDFKKLNETGQEGTIRALAIRVHERYNPDNQSNDIAVIKLSRRLTYGPGVQPICLPPVWGPKSPNYAGLSAIVSGWGLMHQNDTVQSSVLMDVTIPVLDNCQNLTYVVGPLPYSMMCAGISGKDSCQGDSGGPLMFKEKGGLWKLIGIVSWGINCAQDKYPGVYTRVNVYDDWIKAKIKDV